MTNPAKTATLITLGSCILTGGIGLTFWGFTELLGPNAGVALTMLLVIIGTWCAIYFGVK